MFNFYFCVCKDIFVRVNTDENTDPSNETSFFNFHERTLIMSVLDVSRFDITLFGMNVLIYNEKTLQVNQKS